VWIAVVCSAFKRAEFALRKVARYYRGMNDMTPVRQDKFKAYRARKKAAGLREVRMWAIDLDAPGFQATLDAQIQKINASEDTREVMIFCEEAAQDVWDALD
jgi:Protein  of unknown function (DUF3018)